MSDASVAGFVEAVGGAGPVAVEGHRTRWELGGEPLDGVRSVRAPVGVLEHRAEEMTVRVLAGTPVSDLDVVLAQGGQRCALPDRGGTVGGAVVVGEDHLDVAARSRVRATVLQVRYVAADGRPVTGGGPTVKNVTGFDVPRLIVGSLGTLGLLYEVTLRTQPIPSVSRWVTATGPDPFEVARAARRATVLWDGRRTWVHLEGHRVDVDEVVGGLPGSWVDADGPPDLPLHRWSLPPGDLRRLGPEEREGCTLSIGVGTVFAPRPQERTPVDPAVLALGQRAKQTFDPTGRLNPGRDPWRR